MIRMLVLVLFFSYFQLNAQIKLDSLYNLLLNSDGNEKIDLLNNLSSEWNFQNADSSRKYANMTLKLSGNENYKFGHSMALQNLGTSHEGQGHYEKALEYQRQSLQIVTNIEDSSQIAFVKNPIGVIHDQRRDFDKALNAYFQSLAIYDSLNEIEGQAKVYNNIGIVYKKTRSL